MKKMDSEDWHTSSTRVFWGEIAPCDHVVQIYEDDQVFLDSLAGFVGSGFQANDSVIVIATEVHLQALEERLKAEGHDVFGLTLRDQYIPLNAERTLEQFMIDGWPDEILFRLMVTDLMTKAKRNKRPVRAFGEMVAILWSQGHSGATVQLEHLWNKFCDTEAFCLFCAYPQSGFTQDANASIKNICHSHSKMIAGGNKTGTEIYYRNVDQQRTA